MRRVGKVPSSIKTELDAIRSIISDTAAFEILLKEPFPLPSDTEGMKHAIIIQVMEEKNIKGNQKDNIAYILEQKAVSHSVKFF